MLVHRVFVPLLLRPPIRSLQISTREFTVTLQKMSEDTAEGSASSSPPPKRHPNVKYDLYRGHPNMNLLPQAEMKAIMSDFLQDDDGWRNDLNYGANAGSGRFRSALRSFLDRRTMDDDAGEDTSIGVQQNVMAQQEHELFITGGVSHGLELICATHTQPGDEVWVERPTYFLAPGIFKSHDLVVKPLPMISDTITSSSTTAHRAANDCNIGRVDIDRLIHQVENEGLPAPKMIYIIPSSHNPTGRSMTVNERRKLASFAIRNNILLVADEVYHLLDWEPKDDDNNRNPNSIDGSEATFKRPAGMVHFNNRLPPTDNSSQCKDDTEGCCISVSSFTKIWAPGIRLGWIDAPSHIIQRLKEYGYIDSQGGVAPLMGRIMTHAIESNLLDSYLDKLRVEYGERYELVCNLLKAEPRITILSQKSPVKRQGGYFIWIQFPLGVNSEEFFAYGMEKYSVRFMSGGKCDPFPQGGEVDDTTGASIRSCARLCFADLDRENLVSATTVFLEAFRSYMDTMR